MKTILITGSGSGIGKQAAITLAERGHKIIATTHTKLDAEKMNDLAKERGLDITSFKLDVTKEEDREIILDCDIDVLINNAGIGESGSLAEIDINKVRNNFEVNVFGPLELTQLALRKMIKKNSGEIIFVSSILGRVTYEFLGSYSMTKFALTSGAEALRQELAEISKNIHVALIEPGSYHTGFNQKMLASKFAWMDERSYFYKIIDKIKRKEARNFNHSESHDLTSIVDKIVEACEAEKPKLRYSAPMWQYAGVQMWRMLGK